MILYITGPSGAGKSTLAAAWVASRKNQTVLIDGDQITSWLRHGEQSAVNALPTDAPTEQKADLYRISGQVRAAAVHIYHEKGLDVVIAQLTGYDPPPPWGKGWDLLEPLEPVFVVLYPEREACRERLLKRGSQVDMSSYDFDWHAWQNHPRALFLDNSTLSVEESVAALDEILASYSDSFDR